MSAKQHREQRHIVLIHRYFSPDTPPYASILREIALGLGDAGHRVTVLTCQPSYNRAAASWAPPRETLAPNVAVRRWHVFGDRTSSLVKLLNLAVFCVRLMRWAPMLGRVDTIMAASTPPVVVAMTASVIARLKRAKFVYHHQDIYPEVALSGGNLKGGLVSRALGRLDKRTDQRAHSVVVLSDDMAHLIERRGVDRAKIKVINNFDPWSLGEQSSRRLTSIDHRLRVVYAGNLGRFQNLESVFSYLVALKDDSDIEFHFLGDGPLRDNLERLIAEHGLRRVTVHGFVPPERLANFLRVEADVGIVSLNPGVIRAAFPSKTMSYLRNGLPVLAHMEEDCELVQKLDQYAAGWCADPRVSGSFVRIVRELNDQRIELTRRRQNAIRMYQSEFGVATSLPLWIKLLAAPGDKTGSS